MPPASRTSASLHPSSWHNWKHSWSGTCIWRSHPRWLWLPSQARFVSLWWIAVSILISCYFLSFTLSLSQYHTIHSLSFSSVIRSHAETSTLLWVFNAFSCFRIRGLCFFLCCWCLHLAWSVAPLSKLRLWTSFNLCFPSWVRGLLWLTLAKDCLEQRYLIGVLPFRYRLSSRHWQCDQSYDYIMASLPDSILWYLFIDTRC